MTCFPDSPACGRRALDAPRLRVLGFASAILCAFSPRAAAQGVEVRTNNAAATETRRFTIDSDADTANAWFESTNVGIGTTSPGSLLHVTAGTAGDGEILLEADTDNNDEADNPYLTLRQDGGAVTAFLGLEGDPGTRSTNTLSNAFLLGSEGANCPLQFVTNDAARMTVLTNGRAGVATNAPSRTLDVAGTITSTGSDAAFTTSTWGRALEMPHARGLVWLKGAGDYAWGIGKTSAASQLYFFRSATDDGLSAPLYDLVIDNAGDVGIGTTTPAARLQVAGGAIMPPAGGTSAAGILFPLDAGGGSGDSAWIRYYVEAGENMEFRIGIDNDIATDDISFWQAGAERMVVYNGNVGIGYATPSVLLDVGGTIRARDVFGSGGQNILVGDDTFLSDVDIASTLGLYSTSEAYAHIQFGGDGGIIQSVAGPAVKIGGNAIGSTDASGTVRLNDGDNNIWSYWDGATYRRMVDVTNVKNFVIPHPADPARYLVHTTLEGPENAVFYRGSSLLEGGRAEVVLPAYFETLTREDGRTVLLTSEFDGDDGPISALAASEVRSGRFSVRAVDGRNPSQRFSWEVKAVRKDAPPLFVEPRKDEIEVHGDGPYKYYALQRRGFSLYPE